MEPHLWVPPFPIVPPSLSPVLPLDSPCYKLCPSREAASESPPSHAFLTPPLDNPLVMKATPPFLVATSWEWLKEYYSRLVAGQEEEKKGEGAWLRGVGLGLESESESWGC